MTPGYWRQDDLTRAAFDEEGFYRIGDAVRFVDAGDVNGGFAFDGRLAEDFKLATGTWVNVGVLRARAILHFAPCLRDFVVTGHDRNEVGRPRGAGRRRLPRALSRAARRPPPPRMCSRIRRCGPGCANG